MTPRERTLELATVALRNFPPGTVTWDRVREFVAAVEPVVAEAMLREPARERAD